MRHLLAALIASLALACGTSDRTDAIDVTATVEWFPDEGGAWLLRVDATTAYRPSNLPAAFQVAGARVDATLVARRDVASPLPGIACDLVAVREASCAAVLCGPRPPPIVVTVVDDATSGTVAGASIAGLTGPPPAPGSSTLDWSCGDVPATTCVIEGPAPGTFEFDVAAPGFEPQHVTVVVPDEPRLIGQCCRIGFVPQSLEVRLTPSP